MLLSLVFGTLLLSRPLPATGLEQLDCPKDLVYPQRLNITGDLRSRSELDANLYGRAATRLAEFQGRCSALRQHPPSVRLKPNDQWTKLASKP